MKNYLKLTSLILCSVLISCASTVELHVELECVEQPTFNLFDETDADIKESTLDKIQLVTATLRERLESQCMLIKKHNELHK